MIHEPFKSDRKRRENLAVFKRLSAGVSEPTDSLKAKHS